MDEKDNTSELVVVDVRRYKRVKRALAESEERYRQLFENVPIGIYRTTPDGCIIDANPALIAMLGYGSFAELAVRNLEQDFSDASYSRRDFKALLEREGEIKGLEAVWKRKDGSLIHVRENSKLVRGENGQAFYEGTVEDITQGKRAEEAQRIRSQQIEILNCIISKGNTAESLQEMLEVILDCMVVPLAFDTAGIFMYDQDTRKARLLAGRGVPSDFASSEKYMSVDNLPFSQVLQCGNPMFLDDAPTSHPFFFEQWGWRMAGSVPLVSKGRVVGAINVASGRRTVFSPEEKAILEMIGKESGTLVSKLQTEVALRESEKYYRTLIDTSPDIIVVMDLEARMITVNQQFLKVGGYFYDEVIGASTFDFVAGLERDLLEKKTAAFIERKTVSGSDYRFKKKDGQDVPLEVSASVLFDDAGNRRGIIAIGRDIGERKRAEEALRQSENKYRDLVENHNDVIFAVDSSGVIAYISPAIARITGYTPNEVTGRNLFDFFSLEDRQHYAVQMQHTVEAGSSVGEFEITVKDGSRKWVRASSRNVVEGGKITGVHGIMSDITERKRAEAALRQSEEKFRSITEQTSDLIAITDAEGVITYASSSSGSLFHCPPEEMRGRRFMEFLVPSSVPRALEAFRAAVEGGSRTVALELEMQRRDGSVFTGELNGSSFRYGDQYGSLVVIRDITLRRQAEDQLRFLGSITENTSEAIIVTDAGFAITYMNKVGEKLFGYALDEVRGRTPEIFNAEPQSAKIQKKMYKIISSGKEHLGESLNRRKDGSTFFCEYKVMPLQDSKGRIYAYTSVQRDISERKQKEEELRLSEETFRRTFAAIPSPAYMWVAQDDGRITLSQFNQAAEGITQGKIRGFLGIDVDLLYADRPELAGKIKATMRSGKPLSEEIPYTFQSTGATKWLVVDYVRTSPGHVMVITRDVSERKEDEARLLAYQEQLRALSSELALVEERERRRIASELHDQIGQNLALCKLKVAALEKDAGGEGLKAELSAVRRLLECSIQDARSLIFDLSPPVLYELGFQAALEWLAEWIGEQYHVPVEFENRAGEEPMEIDRQVILFQIVRELLVNVGKHSQAGQAKVILAQEKQSLQIQVNDDGVGFDATSIYDARGSGGGFGFFSMRERLNYLGGRLEVRSKPGQGSQVILTVPQGSRPRAGGKEEA
jgi:PAS domain S-box-containing protein